MRAIGYIRVSTDKQADKGLSLDAQSEKIRAMAVVHGTELADVIVDAGESAKNLDRPGMERILDLVRGGEVDTVIVAKLDRLTRSVRDLADLLEVFQRKGVSLVSVAESLDTGSAAGRLVLNIMVTVSQWEREAIAFTDNLSARLEETDDFLGHMRIATENSRTGLLHHLLHPRRHGVQLFAQAFEGGLFEDIARCFHACHDLVREALRLSHHSRDRRQ